MDALATALMTWAAAHTGLPVPDEMPTYRFYDRCEIHRYVMDDGTAECKEGEGTYAAYDHRTNTLFLQDNWHAGDNYHVSALLHELVHHMQAKAGITRDTVACIPGEIERPAYEAQIAWLEAAGLDAHETMGINPLWLFIRLSCEDWTVDPAYHSPSNP